MVLTGSVAADIIHTLSTGQSIELLILAFSFHLLFGSHDLGHLSLLVFLQVTWVFGLTDL